MSEPTLGDAAATLAKWTSVTEANALTRYEDVARVNMALGYVSQSYPLLTPTEKAQLLAIDQETLSLLMVAYRQAANMIQTCLQIVR